MSAPSSTSADIPLENLGPAGIKGELHVLAIMPNEQRQSDARLHDQSERRFRVSGKLAKAPPADEGIRGDFGTEDGSSYLVLPDHAILSRVRCAEGMFEIKKNSLGEKSLVEFECTAHNTTDARKKFQSAVLPFLDYISYVADCPIVVATLKVEDFKNDRTTIEYISPYRKVTINPHTSDLLIELAPVYSMYHEAKNSYSDFYKFLCYYKILEGLLVTLRANIFAKSRAQGIKLESPKEKVPCSPEIPLRYHCHFGKPVKSFFDSVLTPQFRNAVAHFVTDDGSILNMSAPEHINSYSEILYISELCVRTVIQSHETLLKEFQTKSTR